MQIEWKGTRVIWTPAWMCQDLTLFSRQRDFFPHQANKEFLYCGNELRCSGSSWISSPSPLLSLRYCTSFVSGILTIQSRGSATVQQQFSGLVTGLSSSDSQLTPLTATCEKTTPIKIANFKSTLWPVTTMNGFVEGSHCQSQPLNIGSVVCQDSLSSAAVNRGKSPTQLQGMVPTL